MADSRHMGSALPRTGASPSGVVQGPGYRLGWSGAQRRVLEGDLTPCASLRDYAGVPHVYALGPLQGLRGEVTIIDSTPLITTLAAGVVRVEQSFAHQACFLVHAEVPEWRWLSQDSELPAWAALAPVLRGAASTAAIDPTGPFPFRLAGLAVSGTIHVLDRRDDRPHSPERHEEVKVYRPLG